MDVSAVPLPEKVLYPDLMLLAVYNHIDPQSHNWKFGKSRPPDIEVRQLNFAFKQLFGEVHHLKF